jgi:hypothetical protein
LGPVGSIIVAEVMFAALRSRPFGIDEMNAHVPLKGQIEQVLQALDVDQDTSERLANSGMRIDGIDSMAALLRWLEGFGCFRQTVD